MWSILLTAVALMLVLEGIVPFLFPDKWREVFRRMITLSSGQIRFFGLTSIVAGLLILLVSRLF